MDKFVEDEEFSRIKEEVENECEKDRQWKKGKRWNSKMPQGASYVINALKKVMKESVNIVVFLVR